MANNILITITDFKDKYLAELREIDFMMWLSVQWNSTFIRENVFAAVDENDTLLGVCGLSCDGTWYYLEDGRSDIPLYRMQMELCTRDDIENEDIVERALINAAKQRMIEIKKHYPDKKLCMRCWCTERDYDKQQQLLELGFKGNNLIWIMSFDLENTTIPEVKLPENIFVNIPECTDDILKAYLEANFLGFDNVQDAEGELRFRLRDKRTKIITAQDCEKIVSSVTVWHISDERAATENIFTIPEYRRNKIGLATVAKSLLYLKENGYKIATLTCVGDNVNAIAFYNRIGYKVTGHLLEMHWEFSW
ncbi:MAG: GNAT family N-acetyltransferase [Lachnospira sp.]